MDLPRVDRLLALVVGVAGSVVLAGWYTGVSALTTGVPGYASMKPHTAVALVVLALAVTHVTTGRSRRRQAILAALAAILAVGSLSSSALGPRVRPWDEMLPGVEVVGPARMSVATAVGVLLLAVACLAGRRRVLPFRVAGLAAFAVGYVGLLGYAYGVDSLYGVGGYSSTSLPTAVCVVLLSGALLLPSLSGAATSAHLPGSARALLRVFVPYLLVAPALFGWLRLEGERAGLYDVTFGASLLVVVLTVSGGLLLWGTARALADLDARREQARAQLDATNSRLERTVLERTAEVTAGAEQLQTLIQMAPVGIVELDVHGDLVTVNEEWTLLSGLPLEQARGTGWVAAIHPEDLPELQAGWERAVREQLPFTHVFRFQRLGGGPRWVQANSAAIRDADGVVTGYLATVTDLTELREAQARFEAAFACSPLGAAVVSLDGEILDANRRLGVLTGCLPGALVGTRMEDLFAQDEGDGRAWLADLRDGSQPSHRLERRLLGAGEPTWVELSVSVIRDGGHCQGLLYELADVSARRAAESRAEHLALHDPLTGLPNRTLLRDRLQQGLLHAQRNGRGVGVMFMDLDRFKLVNDSLGHGAGDELLRQVAGRLQETTRASDTVARLGGDEFVIVCPDATCQEDLLVVAENLREAVSAPFLLGTEIAEVGVSMGLAFGQGDQDPDELLAQADQAMYVAKDRGRARFEVFDNDLRGQLEQRLDVELGLRTAVPGGEIETWYQPIVDLRAGAVVANEALVRWRRPGRGLVPPGEFIGVAEDTQLIRPIGETVLRQACLAAAQDPRGPAVSVNVSAQQFLRGDLGEQVRAVLAETGLAPSRLWLELTESGVLEAMDSAGRAFQDLRRTGVRLAIDDFGTGFSSFARLRAFDVDVLKLDLSFIRHIERSAQDRAIVEGILRLADSLGLDCVAEGVETPAQRDLLVNLGCRFAQGYLFARPAPRFSGEVPAATITPTGPEIPAPRTALPPVRSLPAG